MVLNMHSVLNHNIRVESILGSRRISNYLWASIVLCGGGSFFLLGLSSYLGINLLPFAQSSSIIFIPQGVIMTFYGTIGIFLSLFLWLTIIWDVGGGYNEFNNDKGTITILRLGFPGKNRIIHLEYSIKDIKAICIYMRDGLIPRREIYLKIKDRREIPITRVGQPLLLSEIEEKATELANFLGVVLEGIE